MHICLFNCSSILRASFCESIQRFAPECFQVIRYKRKKECEGSERSTKGQLQFVVDNDAAIRTLDGGEFNDIVGIKKGTLPFKDQSVRTVKLCDRVLKR
mmetsp:Transcript_49769/g.98357  ORF Transcript_49769/g.98357 Transcript_49769/m.98357 type:complete len:99 (-) Transcript_49769:76-372(-)